MRKHTETYTGCATNLRKFGHRHRRSTAGCLWSSHARKHWEDVFCCLRHHPPNHPAHPPTAQPARKRKCINTMQGAYCGHVLWKNSKTLVSSEVLVGLAHPHPATQPHPTHSPANQKERERGAEIQHRAHIVVSCPVNRQPWYPPNCWPVQVHTPKSKLQTAHAAKAEHCEGASSHVGSKLHQHQGAIPGENVTPGTG